MTDEQALEALVTAARMARLPYNDHAGLQQAQTLLEARLKLLAELEEEAKKLKKDK